MLLSLPLIFYSFAAHAAYRGGLAVLIGVLTTIFALVVSLILAQPAALTFVNRSSLSQTYASRLARTFLGASNPLRQHPLGANINEVTAGDDVSHGVGELKLAAECIQWRARDLVDSECGQSMRDGLEGSGVIELLGID